MKCFAIKQKKLIKFRAKLTDWISVGYKNGFLRYPVYVRDNGQKVFQGCNLILLNGVSSDVVIVLKYFPLAFEK